MSTYSAPIVIVQCDECGEKTEYELELVRRDEWTDRGLARHLKREGWTAEEDDTHYCPDCAEDHKDTDDGYKEVHGDYDALV